jgi:cell shape-determining protein MreC
MDVFSAQHCRTCVRCCWLLVQELEANASTQLRETSAENQSLKKELTRLEDRNNQLQGYGLDDMSADDLSDLIHGLTQV